MEPLGEEGDNGCERLSNQPRRKRLMIVPSRRLLCPLYAGNWMPTPVTVTRSAIEGAANGGTATVSLRLTGLSGSPRVDDVFIDLWGRS